MSDTTTQSESTTTATDSHGDDQVSKLRAEAAKYRVERNELQEKYKALEAQLATKNSEYEKLTETVETLESESSQSKKAVLKLKAALAVGVPADKAEDFADLLNGDDEESLLAHANKLRALFNTPESTNTKAAATDPTQGKTGLTSDPYAGDPLLKAVMSKIS